jgi:putative endonuclease
MFYVYLLQHTQTNEIYIGFTTDLRSRVQIHNARGQTATKRKSGTWNLKYYEAYSSREDAMKREVKLKQHGSAKQKLKLRLESGLEPKTRAGRS